MRTPTINELRTALLDAFEDNFGTVNRGLRSTFRVIAFILAAQLKLLYLTAARVQKNVFPDLADPELLGGTLERFGRARLGRDPFPATQGTFELSVTGTAGSTIRAGLTLSLIHI